MKSFFKKLAFVMALAMVVSVMAPAATAAYADEAGIALQGTNTIVETYELAKAGATVDFCFKGAPKDWKTTYKWTSSNEAVATVDKAGIVTAVAAGTATITITAGADASYVETVVVTVKEEKKADAFTVKQTSTDTFVLTFESAEEAKKVTDTNLTTTMLIGDVEMTTPIKSLTVKDEKVTVVLFGDVTDGFTYRFAYNSNVQELVASIGEIAHAAFTYWTDKAGDGKAYVSTDIEEALVTLDYILYDANGVDVTSRYTDIDVNFELVTEDETVDLDSEGEVIFERAGAYAINLTVAWEDADAEEHQTAPYTGVVVAMNRPNLTLSYVNAGFINTGDYADGAENNFLTKKGVFWKNNLVKNEWILGDDDSNLAFAALFTDNRGNNVVTGVSESQYDYGYFTFDTSNEDVLAVDDGKLDIYEAGSATVLIYFTNTTGEEEVTTLVGTKRITVYPERVPTSYTLGSKNVTIGNTGSTANGGFWLGVYDQYGAAIDLANDTADIVVEAKDDENLVALTVAHWDTGSYGICYNGGAYDLDEAAYDTFSYTLEVDPDKENPTLKNGSATLKVKVYDVTEDYEEVTTLADDTKYHYNHSANTGGNVDAYVDFTKNYQKNWYGADVVKFQTTWWQESAIWVNYENSKDITLAGAKIVPMTEDQTTGAAGYIYYEVSAPSEDNWTLTAEDGKIDLTFNKVENEADGITYAGLIHGVDEEGNAPVYSDGFGYAANGNYKVTLKYVKTTSANDEGIGKLSELKSYTYTVVNSQPEVKFAGYNEDTGNTTDVEYADDDAVDAAAVKEIIAENFEFTFDGSTDSIEDFDNLEIVDVDAELRNGNLRVNSMLVKVELEVPSWNEHYGELYIYQVVKINKTIKAAK